jgi:hypothetical protein
VQKRAFYIAKKDNNPLVDCKSVSELDLSLWENEINTNQNCGALNCTAVFAANVAQVGDIVKGVSLLFNNTVKTAIEGRFVFDYIFNQNFRNLSTLVSELSGFLASEYRNTTVMLASDILNILPPVYSNASISIVLNDLVKQVPSFAQNISVDFSKGNDLLNMLLPDFLWCIINRAPWSINSTNITSGSPDINCQPALEVNIVQFADISYALLALFDNTPKSAFNEQFFVDYAFEGSNAPLSLSLNVSSLPSHILSTIAALATDTFSIIPLKYRNANISTFINDLTTVEPSYAQYIEDDFSTNRDLFGTLLPDFLSCIIQNPNWS